MLDELADLVGLERLRGLEVVGDPRRRPDGQLRPRAAVHPTVVGELEEGEGAVRADRRGHAGEVRNRRLVPCDRVVEHLVGRTRVDLGLTGDDHARTATGALAEIPAVALAEEARLPPRAAGLGEHREVRPADDAVARLERPDAERREEVRVWSHGWAGWEVPHSGVAAAGSHRSTRVMRGDAWHSAP